MCGFFIIGVGSINSFKIAHHSELTILPLDYHKL